MAKNDGPTATLTKPERVRKSNAPIPPRGCEKHKLIVSTFFVYTLILTPDQSVKRENDQHQVVDLRTKEEDKLEFQKHLAWIDPDKIELLKTKPWYGVEFILATELDDALQDSKRWAKGFLKQMYERAVKTTGADPMDEADLSRMIRDYAAAQE